MLRRKQYDSQSCCRSSDIRTSQWELFQSLILNQGDLPGTPLYSSRTKHIDIRYHYIREAVQNKEIELKYCPSEEMIADTLTKAHA